MTGSTGTGRSYSKVSRAPWQEGLDRLRANRAASVSLCTLIFIVIFALLGNSLSPWKYADIDWANAGQNLGPTLQSAHFFGIDANGRDIFVRTLKGAQISLALAFVASFVSLSIGVAYGAIAGYLGGACDEIMMRIVDILYSLPYIFFVIILMSVFGRNFILLFIAIGAVEWLTMARIVRGQTLSLRRKEFVEAARAAGLTAPQIVLRHIVPNLAGPVIVYLTLTIPGIILAESFLSFLGLGVQEPLTSWGRLISEGAQELENAPWLLLFPAGFMCITLICFNFVGDGLRDALDPKDQ